MRLEITMDCLDLERTTAFWEQALGWTSTPLVPGRYVSLVPPEGSALSLTLQKVTEPKSVKNRMHLDVLVHDVEGEVRRLESLGATTTEAHEEFGLHWFVMADPEGNEFCVGHDD